MTKRTKSRKLDVLEVAAITELPCQIIMEISTECGLPIYDAQNEVDYGVILGALEEIRRIDRMVHEQEHDRDHVGLAKMALRRLETHAAYFAEIMPLAHEMAQEIHIKQEERKANRKVAKKKSFEV